MQPAALGAECAPRLMPDVGPITIAAEGRLPERPTLEYDGKRYQRQGGKWLDGFVAVHLTLSQRLDAQAKDDPVFWNRCQKQDREDDPKTRNRVYLEGVTLISVPIPVQPVKGYQSTGLGRGARHQSELKWQWAGNKDVVEIRSDIAVAWRETETAWCLRESAQIGLPGDFHLRVTVDMQENTLGPWWRRRGPVQGTREVPDDSVDCTYPKFALSKAEHGEISLLLDEFAIVLSIRLLDEVRELNRKLAWEWRSNHWTFRWSDGGHYECPVRSVADQTSLSRPFQVQLNAALHFPPRAPIEPVREYDTPFASAGLPSLGKRR